MKNKHIYIIIGFFSLIITILFFEPIDAKVEELYKKSLVSSLIFPIIVLIIRYRFSLLSGKIWKIFFRFCFVVGFFSGLGLVLKNFYVLQTISYLGLISMSFSLNF